MLRFIALCFATGLASVFSEYSVEPPELSPVYSVQIDEINLLTGSKTAYHIWYDETQNKSLLEHYGGYLSIIRPCPAYSEGILILGYWVTTEKELNRWYCWNQTDLLDAHSIEVAYLDNRIIPLKHFHFIEKDVVHGEAADKWSYIELYEEDNSFHREFTTWVTNKELGGVQQTVPLRFEFKAFDNNTGLKYTHMIQDYFDFNTSAIDPEIFNIKRDAKKCTSGLKPSLLDDEMTTPSSHRGDLERSTAAHGEPQPSQEHRPEIFRRHLRFESPQAFGRGGRGGPGGAPLRVHRPVSHSSDRSGAQPFPYSDAEVEALSKDLPEQFDWRQLGAVTPVKEMIKFQCDANYAFAATDAVAAALFLHSNRTRLMRLSDQAIVDCTWDYNCGCHGYLLNIGLTFDWIRKHGLPTEVDYGEFQNENGYCKLANVKSAVTVSGYVEVPSNNENALKLAIFNHGPVTVMVHEKFLWENGSDVGVYNEPTCTPDWATYFALVVGWGTMDGQKYWIVKASSCHYWNFNGYVLIAIEKNVCGVMNYPVYVTI